MGERNILDPHEQALNAIREKHKSNGGVLDYIAEGFGFDTFNEKDAIKDPEYWTIYNQTVKANSKAKEKSINSTKSTCPNAMRSDPFNPDCLFSGLKVSKEKRD